MIYGIILSTDFHFFSRWLLHHQPDGEFGEQEMKFIVAGVWGRHVYHLVLGFG